LKKELRFTSLIIGAFFITCIAMFMLTFTPKVSQLFVNTNNVKTNDVNSINVAFSNDELFAANTLSKPANNFLFIKPTYLLAFNINTLPNKISAVSFRTVFCGHVPSNISTI